MPTETAAHEKVDDVGIIVDMIEFHLKPEIAFERESVAYKHLHRMGDRPYPIYAETSRPDHDHALVGIVTVNPTLAFPVEPSHGLGDTQFYLDRDGLLRNAVIPVSVTGMNIPSTLPDGRTGFTTVYSIDLKALEGLTPELKTVRYFHRMATMFIEAAHSPQWGFVPSETTTSLVNSGNNERTIQY